MRIMFKLLASLGFASLRLYKHMHLLRLKYFTGKYIALSISPLLAEMFCSMNLPIISEINIWKIDIKIEKVKTCYWLCYSW